MRFNNPLLAKHDGRLVVRASRQLGRTSSHRLTVSCLKCRFRNFNMARLRNELIAELAAAKLKVRVRRLTPRLALKRIETLVDLSEPVLEGIAALFGLAVVPGRKSAGTASCLARC
jgi:hypothetical protein